MIHFAPMQTTETIGGITERCRKAGLKATPQRIAVYRSLLESDAHPGPEVVYRSVQKVLPTISLATVYKTLDALCAAGLIQQVSVMSDTKRYDANLDPHHHLICRNCDRVEDYAAPALESNIPLPEGMGFSTQQVHVQFFGVCDNCRGADAASAQVEHERPRA